MATKYLLDNANSTFQDFIDKMNRWHGLLYSHGQVEVLTDELEVLEQLVKIIKERGDYDSYMHAKAYRKCIPDNCYNEGDDIYHDEWHSLIMRSDIPSDFLDTCLMYAKDVEQFHSLLEFGLQKGCVVTDDTLDSFIGVAYYIVPDVLKEGFGTLLCMLPDRVFKTDMYEDLLTVGFYKKCEFVKDVVHQMLRKREDCNDAELSFVLLDKCLQCHDVDEFNKLMDLIDLTYQEEGEDGKSTLHLILNHHDPNIPISDYPSKQWLDEFISDDQETNLPSPEYLKRHYILKTVVNLINRKQDIDLLMKGYEHKDSFLKIMLDPIPKRPRC